MRELDTTLRSTEIVRAAVQSGMRYISIGGGTSAAKTYGSLIAVLCIVSTVDPPEEHPVISIISPTVPKIKQSTLRDWETIRKHEPLIVCINKTDRIYQYNGWTIEFVAFSDEGKARGPRRHIAIFDEANLFEWSIIDACLDRTYGTSFFTYNPTNRFQVHDLVEENPDISRHYRLTYKDNPYTPDALVQRIEGWKISNPRKYRVMGLGYLGKDEGLVYTDWNMGKFPSTRSGASRHGFGMDFGYTDNPTVLVEYQIEGQKLYVREHGYIPTPTVQLAIDMCADSPLRPGELFYCDRDTVMVNALRAAGYNAVKVDKPPDSIESGIALVKKYDIIVDSSSVNIIKELKSYSRKQVGDKFTTPIDADNHALDALRYAIVGPTQPQKGKQAGSVVWGM